LIFKASLTPAALSTPPDTSTAAAPLVSTGETITEQLGTSNQLSLWVLLGVPFLLVSLALVLNFGLGPYSLYFMRETAAAWKV